MNKLTVSGVNTHMGQSGVSSVGKEHQVAGLQILLGNGCTLLILGGNRAVGGESKLPEHVVSKTAAVKSAGRGTAADIGAPRYFLASAKICAPVMETALALLPVEADPLRAAALGATPVDWPPRKNLGELGEAWFS